MGRADREQTDRFERAIEGRSGDKFAITPVSLPDTLIADDKKGLPKSDFDLAERFASIFGKKIIWMQADNRSF